MKIPPGAPHPLRAFDQGRAIPTPNRGKVFLENAAQEMERTGYQGRPAITERIALDAKISVARRSALCPQ
jgi:hypothetical protein